MARRGESLREHILWIAKDVLQELGFERASMDVIAARAKTSKRTLYAHFANKQNLYLATIELVHSLFVDAVKTPESYSHDPEQALVLFCGRSLEVMLYRPCVRMYRLTMAEAERFSEAAERYFSLVDTAHAKLASYFSSRFGLGDEESRTQAEHLLGRVLHPRLPRALFGLDPPGETIGESLSPGFELAPVRAAVREALKALSANSPPAGAGQLSDDEWSRVLPLFASQTTGRPAFDHRRVLNAILWVLQTGAPWRELPARFGSWRTAYSRYRRLQASGLWTTIRDELPGRTGPHRRNRTPFRPKS